jgi:hypothetical protein
VYRPGGWLAEFAEIGEKALALASATVTGLPPGTTLPAGTTDVTAASPGGSTTTGISGSTDDSKLTFTLDVTVSGLDTPQAALGAGGHREGGAAQAASYASCLAKVLGEKQGTAYFAPAGEVLPGLKLLVWSMWYPREGSESASCWVRLTGLV